MKKFIAMIVMVILTMSLVGMAQAETRIVDVRKQEIIQLDTGNVVDTYYEALIVMERIDDAHWVEISQKVYDAYLAELEADKDHHDNLWYVKAGRWCSTAASDVVDWVTFWN